MMKTILASLILCNIIFSLQAYGAPGENSNDGLQGHSHFVVAEDGIKIHYRTAGMGEPILLIHGYYANEDINWYRNGIAQELVKNYQVITVDLRGHGQSDKPLKKEFYGERMWKDVVLVMDDLNIKAAHIHGYSMGGTILTQILFYQPERVLSAVYGGSGIPETDSKEIAKIKKNEKKTPAKIKKEEEKAREVLLAEDPNHIALYALSKNHPSQGEWRKLDLKKIKIPVMAINGEFDSPLGKTNRMSRQLSNFKAYELKDKAHLTAITPGFIPDEYLKHLLNFYSGL